MCPACLAAAAILAAKVTTAGGLTVMAVSKLRSKAKPRHSTFTPKIQEIYAPAKNRVR
jgi:hypothetical protein